MAIDPTINKTGNPLGSDKALDLQDNALTYDYLINDQTGQLIKNRLGADLISAKRFNDLFNQALQDGILQPAVEYAAGLLFDTPNQTLERNGIVYSPVPSELPFTTSGTWTGDDQLKFFAIAGTYSSFVPRVITTVANQVTYTVPDGYDPSNIMVFYDNGFQSPDAYQAVDGSTITLLPNNAADIKAGRTLIVIAIQFGANAIVGPPGPAGNDAIVEYSIDNVVWSSTPTDPTNYLRWSTDGGATFQDGYFARGDTGDQYFYQEITAAGTTPLLRAARESRRELNGGTKTLQIDVSLYSQGDTEWIRKLEEAGDLTVEFLNGNVLFEGVARTSIETTASTSDLRFTFNGTDFLLGV